MATYAIGDIQGCYHSFLALLNKLEFDAAKDRLWLVGDMINRGSGSLAVLRWCYDNQAHIQVVLGNHDLHTIAASHQIKKTHRFDTIDEIFNAEDGQQLLTWLRHQPLLVAEQGYVMVHAGILPQWSLADALGYASEVEQVLQSERYLDFLNVMYGNQPDQWSEALTGVDRLRFITNVFTRMRLCHDDGTLEYDFKGELKDVPDSYQSWFLVPERKTETDKIVFGHWSALKLYADHNVFGIDTGCLWDRELTALCLETQAIVQVPCDDRDRPDGLKQASQKK